MWISVICSNGIEDEVEGGFEYPCVPVVGTIIYLVTGEFLRVIEIRIHERRPDKSSENTEISTVLVVERVSDSERHYKSERRNIREAGFLKNNNYIM